MGHDQVASGELPKVGLRRLDIFSEAPLGLVRYTPKGVIARPWQPDSSPS